MIFVRMHAIAIALYLFVTFVTMPIGCNQKNTPQFESNSAGPVVSGAVVQVPVELDLVSGRYKVEEFKSNCGCVGIWRNDAKVPIGGLIDHSSRDTVAVRIDTRGKQSGLHFFPVEIVFSEEASSTQYLRRFMLNVSVLNGVVVSKSNLVLNRTLGLNLFQPTQMVTNFALRELVVISETP